MLHGDKREGLSHLRRSVEGVCVEDGLDHDEGLSQILSVEVMSVVGTLIGAVVEHLQERRAPQVEHELQTGSSTVRPTADIQGGLLRDVRHLRVEGECLGEPEGVWIILVVISKLLTLKTNGTRAVRIIFTSVDKSRIYFLTSRISCLSSHLRTSGPSSVSARYTANLAIKMAAAS